MNTHKTIAERLFVGALLLGSAALSIWLLMRLL
jgi:hypothetical protein